MSAKEHTPAPALAPAELAASLEALPVGVLVHAGDGALLHANATAAALLGADPRAPGARDWTLCASTESGRPLAPEQHPVRRALRTGQPVHGAFVEHPRPDGARRVLRLDATPWTGADGARRVTVRVEDVTEARAGEHELRAALAAMRLFTRTSGRAEYLQRMAALIRSLSGCSGTALRLLQPDGTLRCEASAGLPPEVADDPVCRAPETDACVCGRVLRRRLDAAEADAATPGGAFRLDDAQAWWAAQGEEPAGRRRGACLRAGHGSVALVPIVHRDRVAGLLHVADPVRGKLPLERVRFLEALAELVGEAVAHHDADAALAANHVAERALEEHLHFRDRLAALGTLAASVAHEVNNPLAAVLSSLSFATSELRAYTGAAAGGAAARGAAAGGAPAADPAALGEPLQALDEAAEAARRVHRIVLDLLSLARRNDERERVDAAQVVQAAVNVARGAIRERARLELILEPAPEVQASPDRLGQVFLNLLVNAAHAIPPGAPDANEVRVWVGCGAHGWLRVEVRDTGAGIAPGARERIFDPFFTTRPAGDGTGLGLSICHSIVDALGGRISAGAAPGRGTVFVVELPPARPPDAGFGGGTPRSDRGGFSRTA